ncbi:hypothetical protein NDK43_26105 [Neobacillus pocheonensis]|uniref:Uncharacterized protein n=1 Tax=Neobacillus pocheonensis TaxID=363869 RepID=A0ABT0WFV4_9BACI|nr:hypothetical protein [Neobacillus pocheonensis]
MKKTLYKFRNILLAVSLIFVVAGCGSSVNKTQSNKQTKTASINKETQQPGLRLDLQGVGNNYKMIFSNTKIY